MSTKIPPLGTKMYCVVEHLYYVKGVAAPLLEYCVFEGEVARLITIRYTDIELCGKGPNGYVELHYYRVSEIGKKVFYTQQEAVQLAKEMTERYERIWGWEGAPWVPLRRPWE